MTAGIPSLYFGGTACKGNPATGHTQDADLVRLLSASTSTSVA